MQVERKPEESLPAATGSKWQFGIRHLLGLMTYCGIVLGVATWQGPQSLVVTLGLGLALLSHLGAFQRWQQGRTQLVLVAAAWVIYLVSLCTPCTSDITVFGWQAAWIYLTIPLAALFSKETNVEMGATPWIISVDLSNVLQAILPLHIWRLSRGQGQWLAMVSCLAMVGPWTTLALEPGLFIAYYIWCLSFMLLVVAVPVSRLTLIGMVCLSVLHIATFKVLNAAA